MRIIAFSDSHRHAQRVRKLFEETYLTTDLYICLGDTQGDLDGIAQLYPDKRIMSVAGNCDRIGDPLVGCVEAAGKKIVFCHGHFQQVGYGLSGLISLAKTNGADLVLYGHTHERRCDYIDGVYYINPGSLGQPRDGYGPSYAAIDIIPAGILCTHAELE